MEETSIAIAVQLSFAPIFLLAGIGAFLNVMTVRLGRVVDRARLLERTVEEQGVEGLTRHREELRVLEKRITFVNRAIYATTFSALLVCVVVGLLFADQLTPLRVRELVALLFIATMGMLVGGLIFFLREISIASRSLHIRQELLR